MLLAEDPATEVESRAVDRVLDVLMDAHARFGFTFVLAAERLAAAVRCERRVALVDGAVAEDEPSGIAIAKGRFDPPRHPEARPGVKSTSCF